MLIWRKNQKVTKCAYFSGRKISQPPKQVSWCCLREILRCHPCGQLSLKPIFKSKQHMTICFEFEAAWNKIRISSLMTLEMRGPSHPKVVPCDKILLCSKSGINLWAYRPMNREGYYWKPHFRKSSCAPPVLGAGLQYRNILTPFRIKRDIVYSLSVMIRNGVSISWLLYVLM